MKYSSAQLIFPQYYPDQLEKGMYFVTMEGLVQENPYVHIYELDHIPKDQGKYIEKHGLPVQPHRRANPSFLQTTKAEAQGRAQDRAGATAHSGRSG